jgi:hypothetical protein
MWRLSSDAQIAFLTLKLSHKYSGPMYSSALISAGYDIQVCEGCAVIPTVTHVGQLLTVTHVGQLLTPFESERVAALP